VLFRRVQLGDDGICIFGAFHRNETETTRVASVRVVHDRSFLDFSNLAEDRFQFTGINFAAKTRNMKIISGVSTTTFSTRLLGVAIPLG
jgi:hypothetical protein